MAYEELIWQIGGQQGEGIDSAGDLLASTFNRLGYYLYGYREFSSRIKGGHTHYRLRISHKPVGALSHNLHLLLALDEESLKADDQALAPDGIVLADLHLAQNTTTPLQHRVVPAPISALAQEQGNKMVRNVVALGMSLAMMGIDLVQGQEAVQKRFGQKNEQMLTMNLNALAAGYRWADENGFNRRFALSPANGKSRLFMIGNQAAALGALMAGCRFVAAYPITPASEVMEYLARHLPGLGGMVVQTEDEIAAITMALGAAYAGARTLTATSGPGLSLMTEAIGLSGMTETPVVIIDAQRAGPSTGMPTKHEQSDLLSAIFGTHGEIPKIVMTPCSVEQYFDQTVRAFNLAEYYQCPVIVLSDVALSLSKQTVEPFRAAQVQINRGSLAINRAVLDEHELYGRYTFTEDGISPRTFPGMPDGIHQVTGLEHDQAGLPTENPAIRTAMMDKRMGKLPSLLSDSSFYSGPPEPDYLLVGYGSSYGPVAEARSMLELDGLKVGHLQLKIVWPFPVAEIEPYLNRAQKIYVVENNSTGQLQSLIDMYSPYDRKLTPIRKYDGRPFIPLEIYQAAMEVL